MTDKEKREIIGNLLLELEEAERDYAVLREKARVESERLAEVARMLENMAVGIEPDLSTVQFDSADAVFALVEELRSMKSRVERLQRSKAEMGFPS